MKFSYQLASGLLAAFILSACSESPQERNRAKDDFNYLNTPAFSHWQSLDGATPEFYREYTIPVGQFSGETGENIDIRPPLQVLELIPGVRVEHAPGVVTLWTVDAAYADTMWSIIQSQLQQHQTQVKQISATEFDGQDMVWIIGDEEGITKTSYRFSKVASGSRIGVRIAITQLTDSLNLPSHEYLLDRYTVSMANLVTTEFDAQLRAKAEREAQRLGQSITFSMGTDRSGLPVIIARSVFDVSWYRIPELLAQVGFEITDKSQSQGSMTVQYRQADEEVWQKLAVAAPDLERGKYNLLFGDLSNRTSINMTDSDGKLLTEEQLKSLVPVLTALTQSTK